MKRGLTSMDDMLVGKKVRLWKVWVIRKLYSFEKRCPILPEIGIVGRLTSIFGFLTFGLHGLF